MPDGSIVSGSGDITVRVWNPVTGEFLHVVTGHTYVYISMSSQDMETLSRRWVTYANSIITRPTNNSTRDITEQYYHQAVLLLNNTTIRQYIYHAINIIYNIPKKTIGNNQ